MDPVLYRNETKQHEATGIKKHPAPQTKQQKIPDTEHRKPSALENGPLSRIMSLYHQGIDDEQNKPRTLTKQKSSSETCEEEATHHCAETRASPARSSEITQREQLSHKCLTRESNSVSKNHTSCTFLFDHDNLSLTILFWCKPEIKTLFFAPTPR